MLCLGYTREGNCHGRPLVLLHGWGCDSRFLQPIAKMFPERDIFLLDLPGYGKSYHLSKYAEDLYKTIGLLVNTIPDGADILTWSCGTLYLLGALRMMKSPDIHSFHCFDLERTCCTESICPSRIKDRDKTFLLAKFARTQDTDSFEVLTKDFAYLTDFSHIDTDKLLCRNYEQVFACPFSNPRNVLNSLAQKQCLGTESALPYSKQLHINQSHVNPPKNHQPQAHQYTEQKLQAHQPQELAFTYSSSPTSSTLNSQVVSAVVASQNQGAMLHTAVAHCALDKLSPVRFPKIRSLITVCGSPRFPADPNWEGLASTKVHQLNKGLKSRHLRLILKKFYRMQALFNPVLQANLNKFLDLQDMVSPNVLLIGLKQVAQMDERPSLDHLEIPSLHLFGANDILVPYKLAQSYFKTDMHKCYVFKESSHAPFLTEPDEFKHQLELFFNKIEHLD